MKPKLSIVLPAKLGYESVLAALDAWESQTRRDQLEILVLCPDHLGPTAEQEAALPPGQIIVPVGSADLHEARALGIHKASSDYIMLAEDHCLPDPDWAQAILDRLQEGWDAVGPALRPGNRTTCWAEGSFLIGYGEWMMPVVGGPTEVLCGWNGTIRTELVRQVGSELAGELVLGAFLVRRLQQQGHRFYLEERARMRHFDPPGWAYEIWLLILVGLGFGAMRSRRWPLAARLTLSAGRSSRGLPALEASLCPLPSRRVRLRTAPIGAGGSDRARIGLGAGRGCGSRDGDRSGGPLHLAHRSQACQQRGCCAL